MSEFLPPPPNTGATPPGYVSYGAMGTPDWPMAARTQPLRGFVLALSILLALTTVAAIGVAYSHFHRAALIEDTFGDGGLGADFASLQEIDDADSAVGALSGTYFVMVLITGCVFIAWQYRHATNARALGVRGGLGPPWAIAGWFVPLGSFVLPGVELHQSSRASDPAPLPGRPGRGRPIIVFWLVAWALSGVLLFVGTSREPSGDDFVFADLEQLVDDQTSADEMSGAGAVVAVIAGVLALLMVRQLSRLQTSAIDRQPTTVPNHPLAPPPPVGAPPPPPPPAVPPSPPPSTGDFTAPS